MSEQDSYILERGHKGSERLLIQHNTIKEKSVSLLERAGLESGHQVLEVGCGTGLMSAIIAQKITPTGHLIATDISQDQLDLARTYCQENKLKNIQFVISNLLVTNTDWKEKFDIIYGRFILAHVTNPTLALNNMLAYLKPGGKLVLEESVHKKTFCVPHSNELSRVSELAEKLQFSLGLGSQGDLVYGRFVDLGLSDIYVEVSHPILRTPEQKMLIPMALKELTPGLLEHNLATQEEIDLIDSALQEFCHQDVFMGYLRMTHIFGTKA